ncbi:hypothetical protein GCM10010221_51500 [Streptomyces parvus]|nr:hypothetical protein GCM10010221_51500 [Streptomyces parvus]
MAQQMVDVLRQAGAERIYGVVGDSLNSVVDAVRRTDGIEWVHVRNEEAAAFAAAAEAQLTGRLAVRRKLRPGKHAPDPGAVRRTPFGRARPRHRLAHPVPPDRRRPKP